MEFRLRHLLERLDRMPMVKALVPFAAGILLAEQWTLPGWLCIAVLLTAGALALLFRSSTATLLLLLTAGFGQTQLRQPHRSLPRNIAVRIDLRIEGEPADRGSYRTVEAVAAAWCDPAAERWFAAGDRLQLYTDSLTELHAGDRILCTGRLRAFRGGSASYRRLMLRRGFAGTLWLSERNLHACTPQAATGLHARAVERIARLELSDEADALTRAMAAGDRNRLTTRLRERFARSGFAHLLAVSGLHTGLLFGWMALLFSWLLLFRRGARIYRLLCAAAVWLFVAAAGFPPSAVRAALLCTLLQGALLGGRAYEAFNALAAAAFAMLLWRPAWIGDISFQLSFVAVAALLLGVGPLRRRVRTRWRALNGLLTGWIASLVAGLATAPLVAHTFGMVPLAGLLLNPLAFVPAAVIVLCGTLWMVLPLPLLEPLLRGTIECATTLLNGLAGWAERLPGGCIEWHPSAAATALIYLLLLAATLLAAARPPRER